METYTSLATNNQGQSLGYSKTINTTSTDTIVALSEAKSFMGIDHSDDDTLIGRLINMSIDIAERYTGSMIKRRTMTLEYDQHASSILLPFPPHVSVDAVRTKVLGVETALASDEFFLTGQDQKVLHLKFPVRYQGLEVDITTGFGATDVPDGIIIALLKIINSQFEDRSNVAGGTIVTKMPNDAKSILNNYRRRSI